jgi:hypothetical protein
MEPKQLLEEEREVVDLVVLVEIIVLYGFTDIELLNPSTGEVRLIHFVPK